MTSLVIFTKAALMLAEADTIQKAKEYGATIAYGAHSVISGRSGDFFLPLGIGGLIGVRKGNSDLFNGSHFVPESRDLNFYRVASLSTLDGTQVVACAVRKTGCHY